MPYYTKNTLERINKVFEKLGTSYYTKIADLKCTAYVTKEPVIFEERMSGMEKHLNIGDEWGEVFDCAWFHFTGTLPTEYPRENCSLIIDVSGEGLAVDESGAPLIGITNGSVPWKNTPVRKRSVPLNLLNLLDNKIDLWLDAGCNGLFGDYCEGGLREAYVAFRHEELRSLFYDFSVLKETMEQLPQTSARYHTILHALNDASNILLDYTNDEAAEARKALSKELSKSGGDASLNVTAIGHAHIDLAWLWPIRETFRKGARTFSTVDRLMDIYPDYKFGLSQPQLLLWMKEYYPPLYKRIQERVKEGRIECQGAMWVEADTNISGGEALIRQITYGQRFWESEFGLTVNNIWLPDVFGYTAALPQIMRKSGIPYFMTQKLSWSEHNVFPHHTFNWIGIDGSSVLTHMLPEETYNSLANPRSLRKIEEKFQDKGISDKALLLFGVGDGGGGPGASHLEMLKRLKDMNGLPTCEQGFAGELLESLDTDTDKYGSWKGELYLEFHRGTYTSQARNKWYNRKMEQALREAEYAAVLAMLYGNKEYPAEKLDEIWQEVLLYQFHDIVPGSSIKRVYDESLERYAVIYDLTKEIASSSYAALTDKPSVFNSLDFQRTEYINNDGAWHHVSIPAMGYAILSDETLMSGNTPAPASDSSGEYIMENDYLKVRIGKDGTIKSVFDKNNTREALAEAGNRLTVYDDSHGNAWDIQIYYEEQAGINMTLTESKAYNDGPDSILEQVFTYNKSTLTQKIILRKDCPYIVFSTDVDWQETDRMLRTSFPVNVYTDEVTCDIQFGSIKRPTHRNTSWDMSKFEICAHKWIDLSRDDYGTALITDSKYGFKAKDNIMEINLLRSSMYPGIDGDKCKHQFEYAFYPHMGNEKAALVEQKALGFNIQPKLITTGIQKAKLPESFIKTDRENIEITAVMKSGINDNIIVRLYQTDGIDTKCKITVPEIFKNAALVDMMETNPQALPLDNSVIELCFKPYEIHTLMLN